MASPVERFTVKQLAVAKAERRGKMEETARQHAQPEFPERSGTILDRGERGIERKISKEK
jgi:hypothetical protein